jgi:hypothetical protein
VTQSTAEVVAHVNSTHGTSYQLVRRLAGGARFERVCHPYRDQEIPIDDFVHGDLNVSNLIVADGAIAAVIDIEAASGGTRAYDLVALAASAARDGAPAGVDEFFFEAALRAGGRASAAISAAAGYASIAAFVSGIGPSPVSRVQLGSERLLHLLESSTPGRSMTSRFGR